MKSTASDFHDRAHTGMEKYDYIICAVCGAMFSYLSQKFQPSKLTWLGDYLDPLALVLLGLAFWFGLRRIRAFNWALGLNAQLAENTKRRDCLLRALSERTLPIDEHGKEQSLDAAPKEVAIRNENIIKLRRLRDENAGPEAEECSKRRDYLLVAAFVCALAAKIVIPFHPI